MNKLLLFVALSISGLILLAQPNVVGEPKVLVPANGQVWLNPKWSPDGTMISFSSESYKGLWIVDTNGNGLTQISDEDGVGFGFSWSPNSEVILVRSSQYQGVRRFQAIKTIDVNNLEFSTLVEPTRGIRSLPMWYNNGEKVLAVINDSPQLISIERKGRPESSNNETDIFFFTVGGKLFIGQQHKNIHQEVADFGSRTIFNVTPSPSGEKIAFQVAARGLYVINVDGTGLKHLGYGESPSWLPNEDYLAVVKSTDDGHRITSSGIHTVCVSTGMETPLFDAPDIIALSPSVAPDGKKMVFENHISGDIMIVNLEN